ncbi:MAG: tripartite tricarboxylate transporter TctB family protein [Hyphomicrobiaceae bacterium]|nr:tripartite tricarboxylate transporter TctB family protein [Hyphomicrobiaceae bacterium]
MSDRILGAFGLALAIFYAWAALQIQESFLSDEVGPKTFPLIIATILGLSSIAIFIKPDPDPTWPPMARIVEILAAVVVMFLYAMFLRQVGFVIATAVASAYLSWRLGSSPLMSLPIGVAISVGIYVVFHLIFGLSLARGPLGF